MMMNEQQQYYFSNAINLLALALGFENLQENRQQSAQNDVQTANDKQAEYLLEKINERFDELIGIMNRNTTEQTEVIWNRVPDVLPTCNGQYLTAVKDPRGNRRLKISTYCGWWGHEDGDTVSAFNVKYWMPLPKMPKEM